MRRVRSKSSQAKSARSTRPFGSSAWASGHVASSMRLSSTGGNAIATRITRKSSFSLFAIERSKARRKTMSPDDANEDDIRLRAYFLWENEGRPDRDATDFWHRAAETHRRDNPQAEETTEGADAADPHPSEV